MNADTSPSARLNRAFERGSLAQAEAAARELRTLSAEDALRLLLLLIAEQDSRYERAAVRWLGRVLVGSPHVGLELAQEAAEALGGLVGASPDVARSRLALFLRNAGLDQAAVVVERARWERTLPVVG